MLGLFAVLAALLLPTHAMAGDEAPAPEPAPIEVMILGSYHMGNPGQDLHNARIDPVTTPEKQAELEAVAEALARFRPTAVAVERVARDRSTMLDHRYPAFTRDDLAANPDERVQVGYRLAHRLGLERVYAIDEQEREGEPPYFPYGPVLAWAEANGNAGELEAMQQAVAASMADLEQRQKTESIGRMLAYMNEPAKIAADQGLYYRMLALGAGDAQPGAVLNGRWYTRNAVIFAHLMQVAKPGDRIVVLYGAGHSYWLRQMVEMTPGFRLVEPNAYLPAS